MHRQNQCERGRGYDLKSNKPDAQSIDSRRKVRFVDGVQITIRQTIDHVPKSKQEKKKKDAFPEVEGLEHRRLANQQQNRYQKNGDLGDAKFHAANPEHVKKVTKPAFHS